MSIQKTTPNQDTYFPWEIREMETEETVEQPENTPNSPIEEKTHQWGPYVITLTGKQKSTEEQKTKKQPRSWEIKPVDIKEIFDGKVEAGFPQNSLKVANDAFKAWKKKQVEKDEIETDVKFIPKKAKIDDPVGLMEEEYQQLLSCIKQINFDPGYHLNEPRYLSFRQLMPIAHEFGRLKRAFQELRLKEGSNKEIAERYRFFVFNFIYNLASSINEKSVSSRTKQLPQLKEDELQLAQLIEMGKSHTAKKALLDLKNMLRFGNKALENEDVINGIHQDECEVTWFLEFLTNCVEEPNSFPTPNPYPAIASPIRGQQLPLVGPAQTLQPEKQSTKNVRKKLVFE